MLNYVTIKKFSAESGYTEKAIYEKMRQKIWRENKEWLWAPDGRKLIIINGYEKWVEATVALKPSQKQALKSRSSIEASVAESELKASPPPLIL